MSSTETPHVADQAGGEVVFSSDGLDPLPLPFKPPRVRTSVGEIGANDDGLVLESVSTDQAFEVFAGKLYPASSGGSSSSSMLMRSTETPLQRLGRLRLELNGVQAILSSSSDNATNELLQQLNLQLEETTTRLLPQREETLNKEIAASAQGLQQPSNETASPAATSTATATALEERLLRLEAAVGSGTTTASSTTRTSLTDRLMQLENTFSKLDPDQADLWQRRAKTIRQDLEAASKARNKLMSSGNSNDTKTLTDLYNTSQQLQGLANHLPALAMRLQAVSHLHTDAATWSRRLQATEQVATQLQQQLGTVEAAVASLQTSLQENAAIMQENMKALDERRAAGSS